MNQSLNQPRYFRKENALIKCVIRKFFLFQRRNNLVENRKINWGKIVTNAEDRLENANLPEAMAHWYSIKKEYPENFLIAYRMGDFYEFFYDDAVRVSQLLGLTLTGRGNGTNRHPLAGIPHKATQYFKTLVKLGQTVVLVEQLEDPKTVKGRIVKRGVIKILSPGTIVDDNLLDSKNSNYICSIFRDKKNYGLALAELSSGEFVVAEFFGKDAFRMLGILSIAI